MTQDLKQFRTVARAATPGPWQNNYRFDLQPGEHPTVVGRNPKEPGVLTVCIPWNFDDSKHIATFDPPTIIELLDRLEEAEQRIEVLETPKKAAS